MFPFLSRSASEAARADDGDWSLWPPFLLSVLLGAPAVVILLVKERVDVRLRGALPVMSPIRPTASRGASSALATATGVALSRSSSVQEQRPTLDSGYRGVQTTGETRVKMKPLPALTTYRAHMMLMTVLAILAVDFRVFPRALAKCESWGVGLVSVPAFFFLSNQRLVEC